MNPISYQNLPKGNLIKSLGLEGKFIFGFHQRNDNKIFSPIPLQAYRLIENRDSAFVLLDGGIAYRRQAKELGFQNFHHISHTGNRGKIFSFLYTLHVY